MFYVVQTRWVGPNSDQHKNDNFIEIWNEPARGNMDHQPIAEGWCGTTNDWCVTAWGEFETIEEAHKKVEEVAGEKGIREAERDLILCYVVESYHLGRLEHWDEDSTIEWCYDDIMAKVVADMDVWSVDDLVEELMDSARIQEGAVLDEVSLRRYIDNRIENLNGELED